MHTTQFDNELDSSNLTCQSINISNRELETIITLHEGITSTSQHGSIDGSDRSPLHCIANSITDGEIHIPGYVIIRKDRNRHGGGVALYIKNTLSFSVRQEFVPARLEIVCVEIILPYSTSFLVCTWYRPPSANVDLFDDYTKFLEKCDLMNRQLFILGDMNCDYFKYPPEPRTEKLKFLSSMYQLQQLISEPTRATNTSATLIDLIFTNDSNNIAKSGVIYNGMSDHSIIYVIRTFIPNKRGQIKKGSTELKTFC